MFDTVLLVVKQSRTTDYMEIDTISTCLYMNSAIVANNNSFFHSQAVDFLSRVCQTTERVHLPEMKYQMQMWGAQMRRDGGLSMTQLITGRDDLKHAIYELLLYFIGVKRHVISGVVMMLFEKLKDPQHKKHYQLLNHLRTRMAAMLSNNGIFIYPTFPVPSQYHYEPLSIIPNFSYTCIFNALGFPVCHVPMGFSEEGVPIGIQVVAGMYQDRLALAVTEALANEFGGWVSPSVIKLK